jgi:hypothetical protein
MLVEGVPGGRGPEGRNNREQQRLAVGPRLGDATVPRGTRHAGGRSKSKSLCAVRHRHSCLLPAACGLPLPLPPHRSPLTLTTIKITTKTHEKLCAPGPLSGLPFPRNGHDTPAPPGRPPAHSTLHSTPLHSTPLHSTPLHSTTVSWRPRRARGGSRGNSLRLLLLAPARWCPVSRAPAESAAELLGPCQCHHRAVAVVPHQSFARTQGPYGPYRYRRSKSALIPDTPRDRVLLHACSHADKGPFPLAWIQTLFTGETGKQRQEKKFNTTVAAAG